MASSSSSASHPLKYDVFLNFRGEDTRSGFTSHLYAALRRAALETFFDDDDLERGEAIAPALPRAIQDSTVAVVVFSKDYASSRWCLDELAEIMECRRSRGQIVIPVVIPVFYKVDPSHLRKQSHDVAAAFVEHEQKLKDAHKILRWRNALTEAANLCGFDSKNFGNEDLLINKIIEDIFEKLSQSTPRDDFEHLVGMYSRIMEIKKVLSINPFQPRILGIWGMGGIGKTTIAKVIFRMMSRHFQDRCILYNVGQRADNKLSKELISEIFGAKASKKLDMFPKERLRRKEVLLVLDDVNDSEKIESLIGHPCWFGSGSIIFITSRDNQVFKKWTDFIYEVKPLNNDEALQLFSKMAFKQNDSRDDYASLSKLIVEYALGNPLALKVLGSDLNGKDREEWKSAVSQLSRVQSGDILKVLQISYDDLSPLEKGIFLDIACFFKHGQIEVAPDILRKIYKNRGFDIDFTLSRLADKCLVTSKYSLNMHDLLQDMGKEIVRRAEYPYQHSRLWDHEDICQIFVENKEVGAVETITLDLSTITEMNLNPQMFTKMRNLRFLNFYGKSKLHLFKDLDYLPNTLRYLRWDNYPSESLPPNFRPKNLVVLELPNSNIKQLWNRAEEDFLLSQVNCGIANGFQRLTSLRMAGSKSITCLPNGRSGFLEALEDLDLGGCSNLNTFPEISSNIRWMYLSETLIKEVPSSSVKLLSRLKQLHMVDCRQLESLPNGRSGFLEALQVLGLQGCSNLNTFPEISINLERLYLDGTAIKQIPSSSVELLSRLEHFEMEGCKELESLPSNFFSKLTSLSYLGLTGCSRLKMLPEILEPTRKWMYISLIKTAIQKLPSFIGNFNGKWTIDMSKCSKLTFTLQRSENCFSEDSYWQKALNLSNSNLTELPEDLSFPSFITSLDLSENNFERIPATLKQLSRLKFLNISNCKRLLSLPDLPSNVFEILAKNCRSLKEIWTLKQLPLDSRMTRYYLNFSSCWKLDEDECQEVVNALLRNCTRSQMLESFVKFGMIYPGSRIPKWVKYQSMGGSIRIDLPSRWLNHLFMGFAFYLCIGNYLCHETIGYYCSFGDVLRSKDYHCFSSDNSEAFYVNGVDKGHMVVFVTTSRLCQELRRHRNFEKDVAFFRFQSGAYWFLEGIKKCGVIPLYAQKDEDEFCGTFDSPNLGVSKLKRSATDVGPLHCMPEKRLKIEKLNEINSSSMLQLGEPYRFLCSEFQQKLSIGVSKLKSATSAGWNMPEKRLKIEEVE